MKLFLTLLAATLCAMSAFGQSNNLDTVTLGWEPSNPVPVPVREYNLYFSQNTNVWTHVKPARLNTQATVQLDSFGKWYFVVVATGTNGRNSLPSNIVVYDVQEDPAPSDGLRVLSAIVTRVSTIVTSTNLITAP